TQFAIEAPDNWRGTLSYNVTLDEMMQIVDNAINNGYTVAWDADVSESGFNRQGLGTVPDVAAVEEVGSDQARWVGVPETEKNKQLEQMRQNAPEMKITQELRQQGFDDKTTTDDHLMHIYGTAKDQNGTKFYMVKNSWGETGNYKGMWYVSDSYVRYKTICVLLHKDAIPASIKAKLNLK
ncbi:MAG: aminopeptidase, partial [Bacteroidales bacterium]|nr:aminopeptidase [Bacteroidales bacterium]